MAPRAYWKGFLRLSLVSCPIALYPATSEREKISFHQLNKKRLDTAFDIARSMPKPAMKLTKPTL